MILLNIKLKVAEKKDLGNIVKFLSEPDIDNSFIKPLSERDITITDRVVRKYINGVWLLATYKKDIAGCLALIENPHDVEISTYAVSAQYRGQGIGSILLNYAYEKTKELYKTHNYITLDSWGGNEAITHLMKKHGYKLIKDYDDPIKRPKGYTTVVYIKSLK